MLLIAAILVVTVHSQRGVVQSQQDATRRLKLLKRQPWPYTPQYCVEPNTFFDTNVVVSFQGDGRNVNPSIITELEESFIETYNTLRRDFCDAQSRKVVDVELDPDSLDVKPFNEFSFLFKVRVGCDRCSTSDTTLFTEEPERRELAVYKRQYHAIVHGGTNNIPSPTIKPTPMPTPSSIDSSPRDEGGQEGECCPSGGERRAPYPSEFAAAYDSTFKAIGIENNPIEVVIKVIEVVSISCEDPLEDFETNVFVEFGGDATEAADSEILALEASFQTSYNGFVEKVVCDPFFREITEVTAEAVETFDERYLSEDERKLQSTARFNYRVKGKCRGCPSGSRLFAQGSQGRRSRRLEMKYSRELQFVFDDGSCFCAVGAEERAVFEDEFLVEYDDTVQELRTAGIVKNVETVETIEEDPPFTWSPTESPTNFPTAPTDSPVPSPSPSLVPSASPTGN